MIYKEMIYKNMHDPEVLCDEWFCDYKYTIISNGTHPCAYVRIPQNHPCFGKNYEELESIDVHGGLTYSQNHIPRQRAEESEWWIGWDYAHGGDYFGDPAIQYKGFIGAKKWTVDEILKDVESVIKQLQEIEEEGSYMETSEVKPLKIYIAGPISGVANYKENFRRAEEFLNSLGFEAVNPAVLPDDVDYRYAINEGLKKLMDCDAIYILRGASTSKGTIIEWDYARAVGMLIICEVHNEDCYRRMKEYIKRESR